MLTAPERIPTVENKKTLTGVSALTILSYDIQQVYHLNLFLRS